MTSETDAEFVERMEHDWVHDIIPNSDDADRLFALARRGAAMQWRPISDAPRDGTPVRLWRPAPEDGKWQQEVTAIWDTNCDGWVWPDDPVESIFNPQDWLEKEDYYTSTAFTHFMPLPPPPAGEQTDE